MCRLEALLFADQGPASDTGKLDNALFIHCAVIEGGTASHNGLQNPGALQMLAEKEMAPSASHVFSISCPSISAFPVL
jgi:hypothetical protein